MAVLTQTKEASQDRRPPPRGWPRLMEARGSRLQGYSPNGDKALKGIKPKALSTVNHFVKGLHLALIGRLEGSRLHCLRVKP